MGRYSIRMKTLQWTLLLLTTAVVTGSLSAAAQSETATRILEATGRRTRVVWTRGTRDGGVLMGFDTTEGKERVIVNDPLPCHNPWITRDGKRILFTGPDQTGYVVDWNGENLRPILKGRHYYVLGVWSDPETGVDWVYAGDNASKEHHAEIKAAGGSPHNNASSLYRYRLDDPTVRELMWDKEPLNRRTAVGLDGLTLAGEFNWPNCGIARLPNVSWKLYGQGCNPNIAPDGNGHFFLMLGNHRQLRMFGPDGPQGGGQLIDVNTMPGNRKDPRRAVWRPRWSNDVRFFTINSCDLGPSSDAYLGQFNEDFTGIARWIGITDSEEYDADAIAWIEP